MRQMKSSYKALIAAIDITILDKSKAQMPPSQTVSKR